MDGRVSDGIDAYLYWAPFTIQDGKVTYSWSKSPENIQTGRFERSFKLRFEVECMWSILSRLSAPRVTAASDVCRQGRVYACMHACRILSILPGLLSVKVY